MPVVGSSAYNTAGQFYIAGAIAVERCAGSLFTNAMFLPYANSACSALGNSGAGGFISDDTILVALDGGWC